VNETPSLSARAREFFGTPFGSALLGGLVVGVFGWLAIAAGWIESGDDGGSTATETSVVSPISAQPVKGSTVSEIYRRDSPGVAYVEADLAERANPNPFDLFGENPDRGPAAGSGFVIDDESHILTNAHVVAGAERIRVTLDEDDGPVEAKKIGQDTSTDLALLEVDVDKSKLHPLQLGDSGKVRVGDPVVAIGNPFGLDRTVTSGIVSALQRQIQAPNDFTIEDVIQTDASINPGNSGGPLIDAAGRVIGITSQIVAGSGGGSVGVAFAVPVNTAREVTAELLRSGKVSRAFLGITGATITDEIARAVNLPVEEGALVQNAFDGGPADKAGIQGGRTQATVAGNELQLGGDIIVAVDGNKISSMDEVVELVGKKKPGDEVELELLRGEDRKRVTVKLGERPERIRDTSSAFGP
jgi:S1-C subfamily serine protease